MTKAPKPPTPSHTLNKLSEMTGHDRRTLKRRLVNVTPARFDGKSPCWTVSAAMAALDHETAPPRRSTGRAVELSGGSRSHWLFDLVIQLMSAGHHMHEAVGAYLAMLDHMNAVMRSPADDPRRGQIEEEMNLVSAGVQRPLHELLLGSKADDTGSLIADALAAVEKVNQRILDLDATLMLTGFFTTPEGRDMVRRVRAAHTRPGK